MRLEQQNKRPGDESLKKSDENWWAEATIAQDIILAATFLLLM